MAELVRRLPGDDEAAADTASGPSAGLDKPLMRVCQARRIAQDSPRGDDRAEPAFICGQVVLLRSPALPYHLTHRARAHDAALHWDEASQTQALAEHIRRLGSHPALREAVELSSPSLSAALERVAAGGLLPKFTALRRAALSLTRYQLRMAARATPFGLMAGVAPAWLGPSAKVRLGGAHQKSARPDMAWLMQLVRRLEGYPEVLPGLQVMANDARTCRGDRIALLYASNTEQQGSTDAGSRKRSVSVRNSPVAAAVLRAARDPISVTDLEATLGEMFPAAPAGAIRAVLEQLIAHEFLLTDLRPPMWRTDPLDYVLERLADFAELADVRELHGIRADIAAYDQVPLGQGLPVLRRLRSRMRTLCRVDAPLQVDLALDAEVALPSLVGDEAARAAATIWRVGGGERGSPPLRPYHQEFLQRYGVGRAVPLLEVLDSESGLDAPEGYLCPPARPRGTLPGAVATDPVRERVLAELAMTATVSGHREVVLDEQTVSELAGDDDGPEHVPPSHELFARLVSPTVDALGVGEFRLVVKGMSPTLCATFGRFAHLLGDAKDNVAALTRTVGTYDPGAIRAGLVFQPRAPRSANVALSPQWFNHRIAIGVGPDGEEDRNLPLADLAVLATPERLCLVSAQLGREVVPTAGSMINVTGLAPNLVRFLHELGLEGPRWSTAWSWGAVGQSPFLPRVRCGRSVLWSATWRLPARLRDKQSDVSWRRALEDWRTKWCVPAEVMVSVGDHQIPLQLGDPLHLQVLRHEMTRQPDLRLRELPGGEDYQDGWFAGPDGPHTCELVFPMLARVAAPPPRFAVPVVALRRTASEAAACADVFQPGGEWLFAKLYTSDLHQGELLRNQLPAVLGELLRLGGADRWFFIRYHDPEAHLRLRFHGQPGQLSAGLLPALGEWVTQLRRAGLASRLAIDAYDPELERYGGPGLIAAAERVFAADSAATIAMLQAIQACDGLDPLLLAAASVVDLARNFEPAGQTGPKRSAHGYADWLAMTGGNADHREAFTSRRQAAVTIVDPGHEWRGLLALACGPAVCQAWAQRRQAVAAYAKGVADLTQAGRCWTPADTIAMSLLHMHCNRLLGADREAEGQAMAIARGALRTHQGRARVMR